jgi:hypothetical protein
MSQQTTPRWETKKTDETRRVEEQLRRQFPRTDAYRFNSVSIRVRVIDPRFTGKSDEERDAMVEPLLKQLPPDTQADIMNLLTLSPDEVGADFTRKSLVNLEFEDPSESTL